jgi:hypothetical protein
MKCKDILLQFANPLIQFRQCKSGLASKNIVQAPDMAHLLFHSLFCSRRMPKLSAPWVIEPYMLASLLTQANTMK